MVSINLTCNAYLLTHGPSEADSAYLIGDLGESDPVCVLILSMLVPVLQDAKALIPALRIFKEE